MPLTPDSTYNANGLIVKEYFLTKHNVNKIAMPSYGMPATPDGITIHNTDDITVASNTTPAEQYTRATINGNMKDVRVHFYVDESCAWQNLPFTLAGWHAADGNGGGNRRTIAIEIIGKSAKAEANGAKLAAWLLNKYKLDIDHLFTHTYWLNKRDGKKGTIDQLNVLKNPQKTCPVYIIPHWQDFKASVKQQLTNGGTKTPAPAIEKTESNPSGIIDAPEQIQVIDNKLNTSNDSIKDNSGVERQDDIHVYYQVYAGRQWLPQVKNLEDYAGLPNRAISCLAAKSSQGKLSYRVHQIGSYWSNWVSACDINNFNGYAGVGGIKIDGIQIKLEELPGYEARYRVSSLGKDYYPWIVGASDNKFAGMQGNQIDKLQIEIVKIK